MAKIDWWTRIGLGAIVAITIATSYTTLAELARFVGWGRYMSWAFPAALDLLALVACRIWLSATFTPHARNYAKWVTLIASGLSVAGNAVGHLVSAKVHSWSDLLLIILVGSVAPASLATVVHLASLASAPVPGRKARHKVAEVQVANAPEKPAANVAAPPAEKPKSASKPKAKPAAGRDLLAEAREANRMHNEQYGQHISLNRLRPALRISRGKATEVHRLLMEEVAS